MGKKKKSLINALDNSRNRLDEISKLEQINFGVNKNANECLFIINGKRYGIGFTIENSIWSYDLYEFDEKIKSYSSWDELVKDQFFNGKSLLDLSDKIQSIEWY